MSGAIRANRFVLKLLALSHEYVSRRIGRRASLSQGLCQKEGCRQREFEIAAQYVGRLGLVSRTTSSTARRSSGDRRLNRAL